MNFYVEKLEMRPMYRYIVAYDNGEVRDKTDRRVVNLESVHTSGMNEKDLKYVLRKRKEDLEGLAKKSRNGKRPL